MMENKLISSHFIQTATELNSLNTLIPFQAVRWSEVLSSQWDWEAWKSWSWRSGLWFCSAAMACKVSLWICLALLYRKTPMNTRAVPTALRMVMWLLNTMMLSHTDRACLTVLATLRRRWGLLQSGLNSNSSSSRPGWDQYLLGETLYSCLVYSLFKLVYLPAFTW